MATKAEVVTIAVAEVQAGASLRGTAVKFGIPRSTLHDHMTSQRKQVGKWGPTVLTHDEEREIALTCMTLADMGFGLTKAVVEVVVFEYLKDKSILNPFNDGVPGKDWWSRFLKCWPCISQRRPQHLSSKRAAASSEDIIQAWFDKLDELFQELHTDATDPSLVDWLWNCDETGLCTGETAKSVIARRGVRQVSEVSSGSDHEHITVMGVPQVYTFLHSFCTKKKTCTNVGFREV